MKKRIFSGTGGLNTKSDPVRSSYNPDIGISDLAACLNVVISDKFRISRRKGFDRKLTTATHSLFPVDNEYLLHVTGSYLKAMLPGLSESVNVCPVTSDKTISYILLDKIVYWTNGVENGKVYNKTNSAWKKPTTISTRNKTRVYYDPPIGRKIALFNGRIFIAREKEVWYSDHYSPDLWALGSSFLPFESDVLMVRPTTGGIFISDENSVWFLGGGGPESFVWRKVSDTPAIVDSDINVDGTLQQGDGGKSFIRRAGGESAFWLNEKGFCYGGPDGSYLEFTKDLFVPPSGTKGAMLYDGEKLIGRWR